MIFPRFRDQLPYVIELCVGDSSHICLKFECS